MKKIYSIVLVACCLLITASLARWFSFSDLVSPEIGIETSPSAPIVTNPKIYFNSSDFLSAEWKYCTRATDGCNTFEVVNSKLWNATEMYCENVYWKNWQESWSCLEYQFPSVCTSQYDPICWDDWKTYSNPCLVSDVQIAYIWECKSFSGNSCTDEYAPVCWVNWVTYPNVCSAWNVWISYQWECKKVCSEEYNPVCWVDGVTYQNACKAGDIKIDYYGPCRVTCNNDYNPVCWINGVTYQNACKAWISNVPIDYYGPCITCWTKFEPVCWVNWVTYENECRANNAWVSIAYYSACKSGSTEACTEEYKPVCWVNWVTYPNACKARNRGISIAYYSECSSTNPVCALNYEPVCWSDGRTYSNACLAWSIKVVYTWKCANYSVNYCGNNYAPVCWVNWVTYSNECKAWTNAILYTGKCREIQVVSWDEYIDEKLLASLEKAQWVVQSKLKSLSTYVLERAVTILDWEIAKQKIWTITSAKKKSVTQYTFIKNVINSELFQRKW
jgi:hypothetical protein